MNGHMAHRAGLVFLREIVKGRSGGRPCVYGESMALETQQIHLCSLQKPRIRVPVRSVASSAALDLDRLVFVHEWPLLICVAFEANQVLRCHRSQLPCLESAVRVMTVAALHQPFVNAMMKRPIEFLLFV